MARPNYYQPIQYVILDTSRRGLNRYLAADVGGPSWVKLHPLKVAIYTNKRTAQRDVTRLSRCSKELGLQPTFKVVEVQLCRL